MNLYERRVPTVLGLLLLVALAVGAYFFIQGRDVPIEADAIPDRVRITNVADNKFSVSWVTATQTSGAVEYGKVGEKLASQVIDERDSAGAAGAYFTHHVTLEGLQPNTQYAFRILSGESMTRFDNNGTPYTVATGPVIGQTPPAKSFYGTVEPGAISAAEGAIVYLALPGAAPVSTLVRESGTYTISLSTVRSSDLGDYVEYDPAATVVTVSVEAGNEQSNVSVSTANMAPVPTITLGQDADFLTETDAETPSVSEVAEPVSEELTPEAPPVLNVEPLADQSVNAITSTTLTLLNPATEGETLATLRPEFRGTGPVGTTLTIALTGQKAISDSVAVSPDGTWSWAPVIDLRAGKQTVTISYIATGGTEQKLSRGFTASATSVVSDPAFVSSPSASTSTITATSSPSATPREAMPATDSGVPVTGVFGPTLLTGIIGLVIMVLGATLLAL